MSLRWFYRPSWRHISVDPPVEFTDSVRLYTVDVTENAEEGSVATSTIIVDDQFGALDFPSLTRIWATETEISASSNTHVYDGFIADRSYKRGDSTLTGTGRIIEVSVVDENSVLTRRVLSSASANRPQESDVDRVLWLANEADGQLLIDDTTFLFHANAVTMDATDYRGQTGQDVLNDCAEQSGKNYYAYFREGVGSAIWYGSEAHTGHQSMVRLSNDLADIDELTTFPISQDTVLFRDPSRMLSGIYGQFAAGATYVRNQSMFQRIGMRDAPMSWPNVRTVGRAQERAARELADLATEADRITTRVRLPAAKVNWIKAGMRLQFKATHLANEGYGEYVWLRVYQRSVAQDSEEGYLLTLVLGTNDIPAVPAPLTFPASAILYQPNNGGGGGIHPEIRWGGTGDDPPSGYPLIPLVGSLEYVEDVIPPVTNRFKGVRCLGNGTLTISWSADDIAGVGGTVTCRPAILIDGVEVATEPHTTTDALAPGFPYLHSRSWTVSITTAVTAGQVISTRMTSSWGANMTVPAGSGGSGFTVEGNLT